MAEVETLSDRRTLWPWFIAEFFVSYASMMLITGCYDWADHGLKATPSQRLWISAAWGFAYVPISIAAGRISEKWGPRRASVTFAALSILACLIGLLAMVFPLIWVVPLIMLPFNLTCTPVWPAIESALTRSPGKMPLSARIAVYNLAWGSAAFVANFTHGLLEDISFSLVFIVPAISCALAAWILARWAIPAPMIGSHNVPDTAAGEHEMEDERVRSRAKVLLKMAWLTNPLAYVAIYALLPVMTELVSEAGIKDLGKAGMIGSVWLVVRFAGFGIVGKWTRWHYKVRWQIGPLAMLAGSMAGMLLVHNLWALIAFQAVFGASAAVLYSASLYYSMHVSSGHGGHAAFHEAVIGAGTMVGPLIGALASAGQGTSSMQSAVRQAANESAMGRVAWGVCGLLGVGLVVLIWMGAKTLKPAHSPASSGIE